MRDYSHIDRYLDDLAEDIYDQPTDPGHSSWAAYTIRIFMEMVEYAETVLDVGCGRGFCKPIFEEAGMVWEGVTLGKDAALCRAAGMPVHEVDFNFLPFEADRFDMIFARHCLEHSPFPLLSLMEWHRVSRRYLIVVLPAPERYDYGGQNHYSVMPRQQALSLFKRSGWGLRATNTLMSHDPSFLMTFPDEKHRNITVRADNLPVEFRFLLEKAVVNSKKKEERDD